MIERILAHPGRRVHNAHMFAPGPWDDEMLHFLPLFWYSLVAPPSHDASLIPPLLVMLMECSGDRTGVGTDFQIHANPG